MQIGLSEETRKSIHDIGEALKDVARKAVDVAESCKLYADGEVVCKVDATSQIIYQTLGSVTLIELLNRLADAEALPKKLVYNDIVYTNVTRTGTAFLYYNDECESSLKEILLNRAPGETDIDILNKEIGVIEW